MTPRLLLTVGTCLIAASGFAANLQPIQEQVRSTSDLVDQVADRTRFVVAQSKLESSGVAERSRQSRLENGEVLFLLGHHEKAVVVLFDLVDDPDFKGATRWHDAVYFLAESLFQDGNPIASRLYFETLVTEKVERYLTPAILRLIEIAGQQGDFEGLEKSFTAYQEANAGKVPEQVDYIYGKARLLAGQYEQAIKRLQGPAAGKAYRSRSIYATAVAQAAAGRLKEAAASLDSLLKLDVVDDIDAEVRELTHLARGRVYYELGDIDASIDAYQEIGVRSKYFDQMLFEITWAYVKRGEEKETQADQEAEYRKAIRAVEILLVSDPRSPIAPDAKVLLGNLHLRMKNYQIAVKTFESVVDAFEPTRKELDRILRDRGDPVRYFHEIVSQGLESLSSESLLPPLAKQLASDDPSLEVSVRVYRQIDSGKEDLREAEDIADRVLARLQGDNRVSLFPTLADGLGRAVEIIDLASKCQQQLVEAEATLLSSYGIDLTDLRKAQAARRAMQARVDALPKTVAAMVERRDGITGRLSDIEQRIFRLNLELEGFRRILGAVDTYVAERRTSGALTKEEADFFQLEVPVMREIITELEKESSNLTRSTERRKDAMGLGVDSNSDDARIRAQYLESLNKERQLMASLRLQVPSEGRAILEQIDSTRSRLVKSEEQLTNFQMQLDKTVTLEAADLKAKVMVEKAQLSSLRTQSTKLSEQADQSAAGSVFGTLETVRGRFYTVVRNADLGIIDVAWDRKDRVGKSMRSLSKARTGEEKKIKSQFDEALETPKKRKRRR
ncbi:MAG: tetratricopeptide repeat protein [Myxococcota bacterium]|nr:tetratricopeptide repeat protein [Myxococcota bacterium]